MARGSIFKRYWKDGVRFSWVIKYRLADGTQKMETIGPNKKEAAKVLAARLDEINRGAYRDLQEISFAEYAQRWTKDYVLVRTRPNTVRSYSSQLRTHLLPSFGHMRLQAITTPAVNAFVGELIESGKSHSTVNRVLAQLKFMLDHAIELGYLASNPAKPIKQLPVHREEMSVWSRAEIHRFLAAVEPRFRLLYMTAVFTGMRKSELRALCWEDIDWKRRQIRVYRTFQGKDGFRPPKSRFGKRWIDLMPRLLRELEAARPEQAKGFVFPNGNGTPYDPSQLRKTVFLPAVQRANVKDIRFHDLRHTYAALLVVAGSHPKYMQVQMGHFSITMTLDMYGHLMPEAHREAAERLEDVVFGDQDDEEADEEDP